MSDLLRLANKVRHDPGAAIRFAKARLKGEIYRWLLPILGHRFEAGPGLTVWGRLKLKGPGRVLLGTKVQVWDHVTPWTYDSDAVIRVGDGSILAGTRFGCQQEISIGNNCIIADCRIMDTDFHSVHANRHDDDAPIVTQPIQVADNCWIAAEVGLLPGTEIGQDSVVAFGSVCSRRFNPGMIIVGNPARPAGKVPGSEVHTATETPAATPSVATSGMDTKKPDEIRVDSNGREPKRNEG